MLDYHSGVHENTDHPKSERGFLGMLRPFRGELHEENFHEVMTILKVLAARFRNESIDRRLISHFWSICHGTRTWAIDEDGMLGRTKLITDKQRERLSEWIDCISYALMMLLDDQEDTTAFEYYRDYLNKKR